MGFQTRPMSRNFSQDEVEDGIASILQLISTLRSAFLTSDVDQVEEKLIARETKLKREIIKLKSENEVLEEKHQFDRLEKLNLEEERNAANERYEKLLEEVTRGVGSNDKVTMLELRRKNDELESEKKKLEALLHSNFTRWENNISRLEKDTEELMNERRMGSRKMRGRRGNGGMIVDGRKDNCNVTCSPVIDLENVVELNENGSVAARASVSPLSDHSHSKGNGHQQNSGARKFSSGGAGFIVYSDDDCAPRENSGLSGVQKKPKFLKRKCASSLSSGDKLNENGSVAASASVSPLSDHSHSKGNGHQQNSGARKFSSGGAGFIVYSDDDCAPRENSGLSGVQKKPKFLKRKCASSLSSGDKENGDDNFEGMEQHSKLNLKPFGSKVNHCSEAGVTSTTNDPSSRDPVNLRQAEEKIEPEQKSLEFIRPLAEARVDCDSGSSSSSSSFSEDGTKRQFLYSYAMQKVKERKEYFSRDSCI
ncbi:hypothetical protein ACE6H2_017269 [Prunus campanulata]